MNEQVADGIEYLTLITGIPKKPEELPRLLREAGAQFIHIQHAKSSDTAGMCMDMLGLMVENKKLIITCLLPGAISDQVLTMLTEKCRLDRPNTGIAFTLPVNILSL